MRSPALDLDTPTIDELRRGKPPLHEPGLAELLRAGLASKQLSFHSDPATALMDADVLWVTFDTPVNEQDEADVAFVRARLDEVAPFLKPGMVVLISSQVPVGFTRCLTARLGGERTALRLFAGKFAVGQGD